MAECVFFPEEAAKLGPGWTVYRAAVKNARKYYEAPDGQTYGTKPAAEARAKELRRQARLLNSEAVTGARDLLRAAEVEDTGAVPPEDGPASAPAARGRTRFVGATQEDMYQHRGPHLKELSIYMYSMWVYALARKECGGEDGGDDPARAKRRRRRPADQDAADDDDGGGEAGSDDDEPDGGAGAAPAMAHGFLEFEFVPPLVGMENHVQRLQVEFRIPRCGGGGRGGAHRRAARRGGRAGRRCGQ
jgi:hypothetical protein